MQPELDFSPKGGGTCVVPEADTQQGQILRALQRGETLTVLEAINRFQCYALSQRIGELKRMGWPIESRPWKTGGGKTVARYSMGAA